MKEERVEAIVIRKADLGEADRLLTVLTEGNVKLPVMAKGVRKPRARLAPWLDMFRCNHLTLASAKGFPIVTSAQTSELLLPASIEWDRLAVAYHICELIDKLVEDGHELPGIYVLARDSLKCLGSGVNELLVRASFEMRLMQIMGMAPELQRCVVSGEALVEGGPTYFSSRLGGVAQKGVDDFSIAVDVDDIKMMRLFATYPCEVVEKVRVAPDSLARAVECISSFLAYGVEVRLKSLAVGTYLSD